MSRFSKWQWLLAIAIAVLAHGGIAFLALQPPPSKGAAQAGVGGITVALGPAGSAPGVIETVPPPPTTRHDIDPLDGLDDVPPAEAITEERPQEPAGDIPPSKALETAEAEIARESVPETIREFEAKEQPADLAEMTLPRKTSQLVEPDAAISLSVPASKASDTAVEEIPTFQPKPIEPLQEPAPAPPAAEIAAAVDALPKDVPARSLDFTPQASPVTPSPRKPAQAQTAGRDLLAETNMTVAPAITGAGGEFGNEDEAKIGSGQHTSGGGAKGATADYFTALQAWLEKHKVYPKRAISRRLEGVVSLRFVMDRQGRVLNHRIERSSGHRLLDRAVETLIERAQPLPPMPEKIEQTEITLVVPIAFVLN